FDVGMRIHSGPVGSSRVNTDQNHPHAALCVSGETSRRSGAPGGAAPTGRWMIAQGAAVVKRYIRIDRLHNCAQAITSRREPRSYWLTGVHASAIFSTDFRDVLSSYGRARSIPAPGDR